MKVGVRIPASVPISQVVALARRAEAARLAHVWFPDSQLNFREVWTVLGAVAVSTSEIGLAPSVTNLTTRHPSVTASAARSMTELCGDRFVLGLGAGDSAIGHSGLAHGRTGELRTALRNLREWMSGSSPDGTAPEVRLRHHGAVPPIFLAASGPRNLRLAGELADGLITPLARLAEKRLIVAEAAAAAGRAKRVEIAVTATCLLTDQLDRDAMLLSPFVVRTAQLEGTGMFDQAGVQVSPPDHQVGASGDMGHPVTLADAALAAAEFVSPAAAAWYARNCTVSGKPADVLSALSGLREAGVDRVTLSAPQGAPEEFIDILGEEILPGLAD
jgi:5,10-methylenetetrahydromethanopterin reductase